jgi:methyl-accepting chemotaxis protein
MPYALYLGFKGIVSEIGAEKYKKLAKRFLDMGNQMENVGQRIEEIKDSLLTIDEKFEKSKKAEEKMKDKMKRTTDRTLLETQVSRIEATAKELVEASNDYTSLVKKR